MAMGMVGIGRGIPEMGTGKDGDIGGEVGGTVGGIRDQGLGASERADNELEGGQQEVGDESGEGGAADVGTIVG